MQRHCYLLLHRYSNSKTNVLLFKHGPNFLYKNLKVLYFTRVRFLNSLSVHVPNNKRFTNPDIRSWLHMLLSLCSMLSSTKLKIANFSHFPCKSNTWMFTTCFTSMYKNMYNSKSKIWLLLVRGRSQNWFFLKSDHGSWTQNSDYWQRPSSMVWLHGP